MWRLTGRWGRAHLPVVTVVGEPVDTTGTADEVTERLRGDVDKLLIDARARYAELENGR